MNWTRCEVGPYEMQVQEIRRAEFWANFWLGFTVGVIGTAALLGISFLRGWL